MINNNVTTQHTTHITYYYHLHHLTIFKLCHCNIISTIFINNIILIFATTIISTHYLICKPLYFQALEKYIVFFYVHFRFTVISRVGTKYNMTVM